MLQASRPIHNMRGGVGDCEGLGIIWAADLPMAKLHSSMKGTVDLKVNVCCSE